MKIPPNLPAEFAYLRDVCEMDEPKGETAEALDLYLMTLAFFGRGAWTDKKLSEAFSWAWMAGFPETVTLCAIRVPVIIASYRYAIRGGCSPRLDLLQEQVSPKVRDLYSLGAKTPWLAPLMEEYNITGWERINYREWNPDVLRTSWIGVCSVPVTARSRTESPLAPLITARTRTRTA